MASWKETSVGSTRTRSKSAYLMPLSRSDCSTVAAGGSFASRASVSTITLRAFISARSIPISRVTPRPKRMADDASSNAYSSDMGSPRGDRSGAIAEPEHGQPHRHQHHRDADARQGGEQRQGAA